MTCKKGCGCSLQQASSQGIVEILAGYQKHVNEIIEQNIPEMGRKNLLRDACEYSLLNGGKRFRPALVLMIANALGSGADVSEAAMTVEYFHTASLIADDLPCMDDDNVRRENPSLHKVYGEAMALLTSYTLIAAGYEFIAKNGRTLQKSKLFFNKNSDHIALLALENATFNTGLLGASGGQFLDIFPPNLELETLRDVIHKKTVSLFELSFVLGWLFGGGNIELLDLVKRAASHFGMAFQIVDDLGDVIQDEQNERHVNIAGVFGRDRALEMFHAEIKQYLQLLEELRINNHELCSLATLLLQTVQSPQSI
jgi:geranylgeranyl diphosphate synthase, type II